MDDHRKAFEELLDRLDRVVKKLQALEAGPRDFDTGFPLHRSEIHTIQAIGKRPGINVTGLAETLGITKGAVSQTLYKLVRKGLVRKAQTKEDGREVLLVLTDLGARGYHAHERLHEEMFHLIQRVFGDAAREKTARLSQALRDLELVLEEYEKQLKSL